MELLSPAGDIDKLKTAFAYGADAVYLGTKLFSLRGKARNFSAHDIDELRDIRAFYAHDGRPKRVYGAVNIYFHQDQIEQLESSLETIADFDFDALIVSDPGAAAVVRRRLPHMELHLSTQANCTNSEAIKVYRDLGFSRVILGREVTMAELSKIRRAVPDVELEVFVHGAMCLAYSGRCLLSAWMAGRSGNSGDCAHSCRWNYRLGELALEEEKRRGEFYPIAEEGGYTTILSSRDLNMANHIQDLVDIGIDSAKIEGRMKSVYYTAVVTRAYRKAVDAALGQAVPDLESYIGELEKVSHRTYSTGFYYGREEIEQPAASTYRRTYLFLGTVIREIGRPAADSAKGRAPRPPNNAPDNAAKSAPPGVPTGLPSGLPTGVPHGYRVYEVDIKNPIRAGDTIEYIGPSIVGLPDEEFLLARGDEGFVDAADHGRGALLLSRHDLKPGYLLRKAVDEQPGAG